MHEDEPVALRRRHDRDGHEVGGERRPRLILELRHVAAEVAPDLARLLGGDDQVGTVLAALDAQTLEPEAGRPQMLDAGVLDAQFGVRDRGEADERADLDVVGADPVRGGAEVLRAGDRQAVGADAVHLGADRGEEPGQVLHVRLARRVAEDRGALGGRGRGEGVFRSGDARLVEKNVGAAQRLRGEVKVAIAADHRAELLQREEVRVEATATDHVAAGRRQAHFPAPRQERRGEQDGRADARAQLGIECGGAHLPGVDDEGVARGPFGARAHGADELDERLHVADARDVLERDRLIREERCGDDGQRRVLVAGGANGAGEALTSLDDELQRGH